MKSIPELIQSGDHEGLKQRLEESPELAHTVTENGVSILQFAAYCRDEEAINLILRHRHEIDIFEAACLGESARLRQIIQESPNQLNAFSADGFTPLGLSAFFGHLDAVDLMLNMGASANIPAKNSFQVTPLHSACATSNYRIAEMLLAHGANVNARQMRGVTPLHSAVHNGAEDIVQLLLQNGADVSAEMEDGKTPLDFARESENSALLALFDSDDG